MKRLRWLLLIVGSAAPFVELPLARWALGQLGDTAPAISPPLDFFTETIGGGLLLMVLASVWRHGVAVAEDQALTVWGGLRWPSA